MTTDLQQNFVAKIGKRKVSVQFRGMRRNPFFVPAGYTTSDPDVQAYIEAHPKFGKLFKLDRTSGAEKLEEVPSPEEIKKIGEEVTEFLEKLDSIEPEPVEEPKWIDEVTGREYATEIALKGAITRRKKAEKLGK